MYMTGDTSEFIVGTYPIPPFTIAQGNSIAVNMSFAPTTTGISTVTIFIDSDDPDVEEVPYSFLLQGLGAKTDVPDILVTISGKKYKSGSVFYFNESKNPIKQGDSLTRTCTIENKGQADLLVSSILMVSGDANDFSQDLAVPVTIQSGSSVSFALGFQSAGPVSGVEERSTRLQLLNNDADENPYIIDLAGYVE
jgi:hypothetical protein